jgi:O-antigen ligase
VERLEGTNLQQEERTAANRYVMAMLDDFPLTGTGAGSFGSTFPAYQGEKVALYYDHAHNDYLQFAVELGIPASLLLLAFAVLSLAVAIRAQFQRQDSWLQGMGFTATMAIIAMGIHATVEFNLRIPANAATFIVMLALAWLSDAMPGVKKSRRGAGTDVS